MKASHTLRLLALSLLALVGSGCTLYQPRPVEFQIRDGDTGEPIKGAEVAVSYLVMMDFGVMFAAVGPSDGVTDEHGKLNLIVDPVKHSFEVQVTADGYDNDYNHTGRSARVAKLVRGPWYSWGDEYHIRLFRTPISNVELTLPDNYRGPVLVEFEEADDFKPLHGKRSFAYNASPRGLVRISEHDFPKTFDCRRLFRAKYAGKPVFPTALADTEFLEIDPPAQPNETVALRFVSHGSNYNAMLYVLGTKEDAEKLKRQYWPDDSEFNVAAFERIRAACHGRPTHEK